MTRIGLRSIISLLFGIALVTTCEFASAQITKSETPEQIATDLKSIRSKLDRENRRLEDLRKEERTVRSSLEQLSQQASKLEAEEQEIRKSVVTLASEIQVREAETAQASERLNAELKNFQRRLVALYKVHQRNSQLMYLAESHSLGELLRRARYVSSVAESDRMRVDSIDKFQKKLQEEQQLLSATRLERQQSLDKVVEVVREVSLRREEKARLLKEAERKEELQEKSLAKLEESAAELERVLSVIMGSQETPPPKEEPKPVIVKKTEEPVKQEPTKGEDSNREIAQPYKGVGLASLVGKLRSPVDGTVLQRFGKQKHEEFSDILFVKGLEFASSVGARVKPVAKGKVILSQFLPGFGNVVIVDHGSRYYTLYGRLASSLVQVADLVEPTSVIGVLGEPDFRGRNFYFELRYKGKAIDPKDYFAPGLFSRS